MLSRLHAEEEASSFRGPYIRRCSSPCNVGMNTDRRPCVTVRADNVGWWLLAYVSVDTVSKSTVLVRIIG